MDSIKNEHISEVTQEDEKLREYVLKLQSAYRTGKGDPEALIELAAAAMGKRSQRQFASDLGVNVSSVSRILSGKVSEISDTLLGKIAAHADPSSGVTLEKLMEAQGMVEAENRTQLARKFRESCRRILADELLQRGHTVLYPKEQSYDNRFFCDFEIQTDALSKGNGRWLVEAKMMPTNMQFPMGTGTFRTWLDSAMAAYYRGEEAGRISLIIDHQAMFERVKAVFSRYPVRDEISILLISVSGGKILDEYAAPMTNGSTPEFSFAARKDHPAAEGTDIRNGGMEKG